MFVNRNVPTNFFSASKYGHQCGSSAHMRSKGTSLGFSLYHTGRISSDAAISPVYALAWNTCTNHGVGLSSNMNRRHPRAVMSVASMFASSFNSRCAAASIVSPGSIFPPNPLKYLSLGFKRRRRQPLARALSDVFIPSNRPTIERFARARRARATSSPNAPASEPTELLAQKYLVLGVVANHDQGELFMLRARNLDLALAHARHRARAIDVVDAAVIGASACDASCASRFR